MSFHWDSFNPFRISSEELTLTFDLLFCSQSNAAEVRLFFLVKPAATSDRVAPLALIDPGAVIVGQTCVVSGWGHVESVEGTDILHTAKMKVIDRASCTKKLQVGVGYDRVLTTQICAEPIAGGDGAICTMDPGSPLVCFPNGDPKGKPFLAGILQGRPSCKCMKIGNG